MLHFNLCDNHMTLGSRIKKRTLENMSSSNLLRKCTGQLTVRLLVAGTSSRSTELLGLAATWISNQQGPVVLDQDVLDLLLGGFIHICHKIKTNPVKAKLKDKNSILFLKR